MTTTTPSPESAVPFWLALIGGVLLVALGTYGLLTQSGSSPRYGAALVALGLAGVVRALAPASGSRAVGQAPLYLTGAAWGLVVAGFIG